MTKIDLITYLLKLENECKVFSFLHNFSQKQIIKVGFFEL